MFFFFLLLSPCVIYCAMTFYYFLCYCIIFLHTYPYKHVHMLCFFFFSLNCLILLMFPVVSFIIIWDESGMTNESWSSVFISTGEREAWRVSTVHSSLALCCPLCTLKCSFPVLCLSWELRFKSLTNVFVCWAAETTRFSSSASCCHSLPWQLLWDSTVSPHRSGAPRTQGADPHPLLKKQEKNQSTTTDELSFIRSNVCDVSKKNQYLVSDICNCWTTCAIFPAAEVYFAVFFSPAVVHQRRGSFTKSSKMQRCWPFEGDSQIFFYMVGFVWRKKNIRSLFYTQIRCKKGKKRKKSSSKKLVFHYPLTQRNLSFAIIVICSTFVNTMFLINVHRHECQYNCKRF